MRRSEIHIGREGELDAYLIASHPGDMEFGGPTGVVLGDFFGDPRIDIAEPQRRDGGGILRRQLRKHPAYQPEADWYHALSTHMPARDVCTDESYPKRTRQST